MMDCEQALALISARIDREILPSENAWLSEHLRECPACQATAEAFALQHKELRETFKPRRAAAVATADRANAAIGSLCGKPPRRRLRLHRGVLIGAGIGAAWLAAAILLFSFLRSQTNPVFISPSPPFSGPAPQAPVVKVDKLKPRPLPLAPQAALLQQGQTVTTAAGERRRMTLPDGSAVYLNENTTLACQLDNVVALKTGTAYFEFVPNEHQPGSNVFTVATNDRYVFADGTKFAAQIEPDGTRLLAVTGDLTVTDSQQSAPGGPASVLHAGEMLAPHTTIATASPRLSHVLDWTRDLLAASEPSLIPVSSHDGGALIAVDASGQEAKLNLRIYHVDVHIEDGFARTTIDQTYFNQHPWRLEGTFYFPLPPDASLSRLAMYVDGELNEGGMVERDYGRTVFERIVNNQRDPALLEWVDGSTFKMRVFPLEGRQEKRLILSYTQRIPSLYGRSQYRFPAGHTLQNVRDWSFHALVKNGAHDGAVSPTHPGLKQQVKGEDLVLDDTAKECKVDREVVLDLTDPSFVREDNDVVRFSRAELDGNDYLMMRYRPQLPAQKTRLRRDWIFLYESSADRDPLLARTQIEIIRGMLQNAQRDDTFRIFTASNRLLDNTANVPASGAGGPVPPGSAPQVGGMAGPGGPAVDTWNVGQQDEIVAAMSALEETHLVGALDLGQALRGAEEYAIKRDNPYLVHLGGGYTGMGTPQDELPKLLSPHTHYIGIGVGKHWNRAFMKQCAEKTGGYFTQINPDESISWRTFDLMATLNTPRLLDVKVSDARQLQDADKNRLRFLLDTNAIAQGEELCAVSRLRTMPENLTITGLLDGEKFERRVRVEKVAPKADYLPRTWAKLEIDRLLTEDARKNKNSIVDLSKAMYVMTPFTSLLVLENEAMYKEFKVERGRKDHWAMYDCPSKIPVVYEPDPTMPVDLRNAPKGTRPAPQEVLQSVLVRVPPQWPALDGRQAHQEGIVRDGNSILADVLPATEVRRPPLVEPAPWTFAAPQNSVEPRVVTRGAGGGTLDIEEQVADLLQPPPARFTTGDVLNDIATRLNGRDRPLSLPNSSGGTVTDWSVEQQHFIPRPRLFSDLLGYAPGLNTSKPDLLAVLDAEALPDLRLAPGHIDPAARRLIDAARAGGWRKVTVLDEKNQPSGEIVFDGAGRYRYEDQAALGLREMVVCNGTTLLHVYPEIGLAGRRTVTRFHRAEFVKLLPWLLPPADDLARGADVECVDAKTVAVVPRPSDAAHTKLHLLFKDGRLVERRLIEIATNQPVLRELYQADGVVRILDRDEKEVQHAAYRVQATEAPNLRPDLSDLVVLSLPFRSVKHVMHELKLGAATPWTDAVKARVVALNAEDSLTLLTTLVVDHSPDEAQFVYAHCIAERRDTRRGLFTLLAAADVDLSHEPSFRKQVERQPDDDLLQYLALCDNPYYQALQKRFRLVSSGTDGERVTFLQELAQARGLLLFWNHPRSIQDLQRELPVAEAFVDRHLHDGLGHALLLQMQDARDTLQTDKKPLDTSLAKEWGRMSAANNAAYRARFEHACSLHKAGQRAEAVAQLKKLYQEALNARVVALLDDRFKDAAQEIVGTVRGDQWTTPIRQTAMTFLDRQQYDAVLSLAQQCRRIDEQALAATLLDLLLRKTQREPDSWVWRLAVVDCYAQSNDLAQAEELLQPLLEQPQMAEAPLLWRLASAVAERRGKEAKAVEYWEKALDLEYRQLPDVIELQHWRADYGRLLGHYYKLAASAKTLGIPPPKDLSTRTLRVVDRWRAHDPEQGQPCLMAAAIFALLGEQDLAWDYLTTTVGGLGNEVVHWRGVAGELSQAGEMSLADRALVVASDVDPRNAAVVWQRAQTLRLANRKADADRLLRRLAEEKWPPEYQSISAHARQTLEGG
jgi:tetratricopeptide (TPR) repeat protein